jgi:hypothetical protein
MLGWLALFDEGFDFLVVKIFFHISSLQVKW